MNGRPFNRGPRRRVAQRAADYPDDVIGGWAAEGTLEVFVDEAGVERVRVTPKGLRAIGVSEDEIAELVEAELKAGRPYKEP